MSSPDTRWDDVIAWRARMVVGAIDEQREDLIDEDGWVVVFKHTLDDYDFLFGEIKRLKGEVAALSSAHHTTPAHRVAARFQKRLQTLGRGLQKYRQQHVLDRDFIQRQKRELRRLNKLVPATERAQVSAIKVGDACPLCGCTWPIHDHDVLRRKQAEVAASRDALVVKLKDIVGAQRRAAHNSEVANSNG